MTFISIVAPKGASFFCPHYGVFLFYNFFSCFLDKRAWFYSWCLGAWSHRWWLV